ncbi:MAG: hypothetical protein SOZ63_02125 [Eggerthellaceae bacterium]|nr:hypothetical protein [Eggerthellaceae bacterium]
MKTVLFIEEKSQNQHEDLIETYREYSGLFVQCLEAFDIHVCPWNPDEYSISKAVPDLLRIIDRSTEWRAIIATDLSFGCGKQKGAAAVGNPFDLYDLDQTEDGTFMDKRAIADPEPIVRLSRMLGGVPRAFRNRTFVRENYPDLPEDEMPDFTDSEPLMERYHLGCVRPAEMLFVSPRNRNDELLISDNGRCSGSLANAEYLHWSFAECAGFADRSRFVVVDRSLPPCISHGRDMLQFWMTVMALATYDPNRGSLQFGQLYRAEVEFDEEEIRSNLISHYADCCQVRDKLKERMIEVRRLRIPSETEKAFLPDFRKKIHLTFNLLDSDKMYLDAKRFGLFSNIPTEDESEYAGQKRRIKKEAETLFREPKRALRQAEDEFQTFELPSDDEILRNPMNRHTTDLLVAELEQIEERISIANPMASLNCDDLDEEVKDEEKAVKHRFRFRVSLTTIALALSITAATIFVGYAPFIFGLTSSITFNLRALIATVIMIAVMVGICLLDLKAQKKLLDAKIGTFNKKIASIIEGLRRKCDQIGNRMSDFASFRRGWYYLKKNDETPKFVGKEEEYLAKSHADLCVEIDRIQADAMFNQRYEDAYRARSYMSWNAADDMVKSGRVYNFSLSAEDATARYNTAIDGAARTRVPFSAIVSLDVMPINPVTIGRVTR